MLKGVIIVKTMPEDEVIQKIAVVAEKTLVATGVLRIERIELSPLLELNSQVQLVKYPDLEIYVRAGGGEEFKLIFEVKSLVQPRYINIVSAQFRALMESKKNWYGILGAPYISKESMLLCRENGIGCMDLAGNCYLSFNGVYINIQGKKNPYQQKRPLKSIFYSKSTRVLRVLLSEPARNWRLQELASEAQVSIGLASNVRRRLIDYDLVILDDEKAGFKLKDPQRLLKEWAKNYSYRDNDVTNFYSLDKTQVIEDKVADYCKEEEIKYAFTLTSGANLAAPFLRYNRVFFYTDSVIDPIAEVLGWKEVSSGSNISVLKPYDEGVFYGQQLIKKKKVVSDLQLYLDLQSYEQRGQEAAEYLLAEKLAKNW